MERGSSSSSSPSSNSSDSLNGLKFGQKIYFEDVGFGPPPNSFGGSSSSSSSSSTTAGGSGGKPPPPPKKGRNGVVQGGGPPRCQVEGCRLDLSDAKTYYSRHKVCGMHSKSPKVVVGGLEQRFCQQCSRFHQLPEFDQGKRSCRRRLAGHNERRRKPPPGSLLSSHFGRVSSSAFENNKGGGFLMDFSTYPRLTRRDPWPTTRATDRVSANQHTTTGKFLLHPWQSDSENLPSDLFLQGSASGAGYSGPIIPSRECFTRVSDSGCAPSLLSNESWGSSDRSLNLGVNNFLTADGAPTVQSTAGHGAPINHFSTTSWSFKGNEVHSSSHEMPPDLGHHQLPQPANNPYPGGAELAQQSGRQYMELEHSRAYDSSTQHIHWSL